MDSKIEFDKFLKEHESTKNHQGQLTLTSLKPRRAYFISLDDNKLFWDLYYDVFTGENNYELTFNELLPKNENHMLFLDLDFKFHMDDTNDKNHMYDVKFIDSLIKEINEEINKIWELDNEEKYAIIFQRPEKYVSKDTVYDADNNPVDADIYKDGIHIIYPYIVSNFEVMEIFRKNIRENENIIKLFESLDLICKDTRKIVDSVSSGWMILGSSKPGIKPYLPMFIYDCNNNRNDFTEDRFNSLDLQNTYNICHFFSMRRHIGISKESIITDDINTLINKRAERKIKYRNKKMTALNDFHERNEPEFIQKLLDMLDQERCEYYNDWIRVGLVLHNISPDKEMYNMFLNFTKRSSKFKQESYCKEKWDSFKNEERTGNVVTLRTLHYFAKEDSPEEYSDLIRSDLRLKVIQSQGTNDMIAEIMYQLNKDKYVTIRPGSGSQAIWYYFDGINWKINEGGYGIRKSFSTPNGEIRSVISIYLDAINDITEKQAADDIEEAEKKALDQKKKDLLATKSKLESTGFRDNVMKELSFKFYDETFFEKLDTKPYLLAFKNGVYDFQTMEFRKGYPEDYLSLNTNINYVDYSKELPYINEINDCFEKIFVDKDIREYQWLTIASCLIGKPDCKLHMWEGGGRNGKSFIGMLILNTLGDYARELPVTLLTSDEPKSGAPDPLMLALRSIRLAIFEEPNGGAKFNTGRLKRITGNTKLSGRPLHKTELVHFMPQFKIVINQNNTPDFPSNDGGVARRIQPCEYKTRFCEDPDPKNKYEHLVDETLSERFPLWVETFMSMLINKAQYLLLNYKGIVPIPKVVREYRTRVENKMDIVLECFREICEKTDDKDDIIKLSEFYQNFIIWLERNYPTTKKPSKRDVVDHMKMKLNFTNSTRTKFSGYRFKASFFGYDEEKEEENDIEHNVRDLITS